MTDKHAPQIAGNDVQPSSQTIEQCSAEASQDGRDDPQTLDNPDQSHGSVPLLGLNTSRFEDGSRTRTTSVENMRENDARPNLRDRSTGQPSPLAPLLGTSYSQDNENNGGSSARRSPERVCYAKLLQGTATRPSRDRRQCVRRAPRDCYTNLLQDLPKGVFRRGAKLCYRHVVPVDVQRLTGRRQIWRSLRTDSLTIAARRLPIVIARVEAEIEHARAMAGLPVDPAILRPFTEDPSEFGAEVVLTPPVSVSKSPITLAEAYRSYIDDPTRAWTSNTRQAYETSRKLALAIIGGSIPISAISRIHCRDMLDVLRFLPANAAKVFPKLSPREAAERAREIDLPLTQKTAQTFLCRRASYR